MAIAPATAAVAKYIREGTTSAALNSAAKAVPATKPSCTIAVSHPVSAGLSCQRVASCGETALAANQSDIPKSSAAERSASMRHRAGCESGTPAEPTR